MKPLLPKPSTEQDPRLQPSSASSLARVPLYQGPKRRASAVKAACQHCRQSRAKCDGQRPSCRRCLNRDLECSYDVQQGLTRHKDLKIKYAIVKSENVQLKSTIDRLRTGDEAEAQQLLKFLRASTDSLAALHLDVSRAPSAGDSSDNQGISPLSGSLPFEEWQDDADASWHTSEQWLNNPIEMPAASKRRRSLAEEDDSNEEVLSPDDPMPDVSPTIDPDYAAEAGPSQRRKQRVYPLNEQSLPSFVSLSQLQIEMPSSFQVAARHDRRSPTKRERTAEQESESGRERISIEIQATSAQRALAGGSKNRFPDTIQAFHLSSLHTPVHLHHPLFSLGEGDANNCGLIMSSWELEFIETARARISIGSLQAVLGPPLPVVKDLRRKSRQRLNKAKDVQTWVKLCMQQVQGLEAPEFCASNIAVTWYLRWLIFPCVRTYSEIPQWLRPSQMEIFTPHLPIYHTIPWSGLRKRMITHPADVLLLLACNISVNWPHSNQDIFATDEDTGEEIFNPLFLAHIRNLDNWSLNSAVLNVHPEWLGVAKFKDVNLG